MKRTNKKALVISSAVAATTIIGAVMYANRASAKTITSTMTDKCRQYFNSLIGTFVEGETRSCPYDGSTWYWSSSKGWMKGAGGSLGPSGPGGPGTSGIAVGIETAEYPTSLVQYYGFGLIAPDKHLGESPITSLTPVSDNIYNQGFVLEIAVFKVVDASGAGVSGVQVDCWASSLTDDQNGHIDIEASNATINSPVTKTTDSNGEVAFAIGYHLTSFAGLLSQHNFGCCLYGSRVGGLNINATCGAWGILPTTPCYANKKASTSPRVYTITAGIHATTLQANFAIGCHVESEAFW